MLEDVDSQREWQYFLSIEEDLAATFSFVEPCCANESTYSTEYAKILLAAASATDTVLKRLCVSLDSSSEVSCEQGYRKKLVSDYGLPFSHVEVIPLGRGLGNHPWQNWTAQNPHTPDWWTAYNKVKHHFDRYFDMANLGNAYRAVSGLLIALVFLYRNEGIMRLSPAPKFLTIVGGVDVRRDIMCDTANTVLTIKASLPEHP